MLLLVVRKRLKVAIKNLKKSNNLLKNGKPFIFILVPLNNTNSALNVCISGF